MISASNLLKLNSLLLASAITLFIIHYSLFPRGVPPAKAQGLSNEDAICIGNSTAHYMNEVIKGAGKLNNIQLLSPAFNMTSPYFQDIVTAMGDFDPAWTAPKGQKDEAGNFAGIYGVAGNAYNFGGNRVTGWVSQAMSNPYLAGRPVLVTETGKIDFGIDELADEMNKIKGGNYGGVNYLGALLFNAFNTNPSWNSFSLTDPEISSVCGGSCARRIGVNSATFFPQDANFYTRASSHTMGFTLEIANNNVEAALAGINEAHSRGLTPVIRIGVGSDSGGFTDPKDYVDFLKAIDSQVSGLVYAIAGPNEPESEPWAAEEYGCKTLESPLKNAKCNQVSDPEFHSLRPYPANPCDLSIRETTYMCANQFVAKETFRVSPNANCESRADGSRVCTYNMQSTVKTSVNLDDSFLPILGNTELVPNSEQETGSLDLKTRVNEYVSWYLNGVINRPEEDPNDANNPEAEYNLVNLSGPLNKLLPWSMQANYRRKQIRDAYESVENDAGIRHDQIASCFARNLVPGLFGDAPARCYFSSLILNPTRVRLSGWIREVGDLVSKTIWPFAFPPLEHERENSTEYLRAYRTWRAWVCSPIGPLLCIPGLERWWSRVFPYIPYSSTEDRKGVAESQYPPGEITAGSGDDLVEITAINYVPDSGGYQEILYFPHMQEVAELSSFLQKTFAPRGQSGNTNTKMDSQSPTIEPGCTIVETRSNPGDDLHAEVTLEGEAPISGILTYNATFKCKFAPGGETIDQNIYNQCLTFGGSEEECTQEARKETQTCTKDIYVGIPMQSQTPKIEEIWNRLVEGDFAVFKRIFPKFGPNAPFEKLKDIPGVTTGKYSATGGSGNSTVDAIAGDESQPRPGGSAEIYFPHVGSLSEYFLKGIQTALRPKGYGELALTGQGPVPKTGPGAGTCQVKTSGACSVDNLLPYFGKDRVKASNASQICSVESGGSEFALNDGCLSGRTYDYSVGLFQINLLANNVVDPDTGETLNCPSAFSAKDFETKNCTIGNQSLLDRCVDVLQRAEVNIQKAVELSRNGVNWNPWLNASRKCGITSGVQ